MDYPSTRFFGRKGYDLHLMHLTKRNALRNAKELRGKGFNVRVVHHVGNYTYPYATYKNRRRR